LPVTTSATDADAALPVAERGAGSEAAASAALARPSQEAVLLAEADRLRQSMVTQAAAVAPQVAAAPVVLKAAPDDEELASQVVTAVQAWRAAWEQGDLEAYMAHYAPRAKQGTRRNTDAIRKQKKELWSRAKPASVLLEDMRVNVKNDTAQVVMRQKYADEKGNGDIGRKTLALTLRDGAWLITQEDWSALPHEISN
jgi:ketosteroid isomerase-like protein